MSEFLPSLGIKTSIIQAPMAGVSTPEMAAAVSNAGGLGSIGVGSVDADATRQMIRAIRAQTSRPFSVNVFCHKPAVANAEVERAWLQKLGTKFSQFGAQPPVQLHEVYESFLTDDAKLQVLIEERPAIVSFHFGLPGKKRIAALHDAGIAIMATATSLAEGKIIAEAGIDAVVAQGYEAGGHRGIFDADDHDDQLGTFALTRLLVRNIHLPVIAAGGIMDGAGIAAALMLGAAAAQLGTAFIACPESLADDGYRAALLGAAAEHTIMTAAISGRPARCLANRFTSLGETISGVEIPDYPIAYDAGKQLHAVAKSHGEFGFGAQWAGQGAPLSRAMPAAKLVDCLRTELERAQAGTHQ